MLAFLPGLLKIPAVAKGLAMILALGLVAAVTFAGYRYVTHLTDALAAAQSEAEVARLAVKLQAGTIDRLGQAIDDRDDAVRVAQAAIDELTRQARANAAAVTELDATLARHDLAALAAAKPGLIETRINAATARLLADLAEASRVEP